ncbi:ste/ste11/ste11-unclassified protein kinase [Nannizzia gypsea CBS 118893]|uniref:mitogen-activated protein kinase kinase kinase n=1 Tax=Arthroderma gypseum (strain ATCC MYA-4604 / CBS 118893) TaxID=535722 RepID=E4UTJ7_ARTGP|nr:ste/ste11/ste11-unclassified protein kinase [Nannizzia gypsea CBS 118893]EFR00706.1 ste/ste11/ste11-unclassified protein kinase [Nannizzia gypsea CBS 118893]
MITSQPALYGQSFPMAPPQSGLPPSASAASSSYTNLALQKPTNGVASRDGLFTSPTESEFSEGADQLDPVRSWDEKKVGEWLHSIRCGQYEPLFKANHFTGDNLLDCDQKILQEMGIKKVGDRVRIYVAVKQLRNRAITYRKKKNRDSLAALEASRYTPPSSETSRLSSSNNNNSSSSRYQPSGRQWSRNEPPTHTYNPTKPSSRPNSPLAEPDRQLRQYRYNGASPMESIRREQGPNYFGYTHSNSSTSRHTTASNDQPQAPRTVAHIRQNPSNDGLTISSLPTHSPVIRVIHTGGQTKALNIKQCKTADDIMVSVLKKLLIPESHYKNYCFYVLDGLDSNPANCRRISDVELLQICDGSNRSERGRLILRNIHAGEPDLDELELAARLATDESQVAHMNAMNTTNLRNQIKLQKLTGESWDHLRQPMSPITDRSREDYRRAQHNDATERDQSTKLRSFFGARPPSEMIIHELTSYFPSHQKEDIEKTMRLSVRRSQRMSRAASRLSVMSGVSLASSMKDAPPIPSIADTWLSAGTPSNPPSRAGGRPLSVSRINIPSTSYRDSIASSALEPLQEESPIQDSRKSYVSFDDNSDNPIIEEPERHTFLDETLSVTATDGGGSMSERLSMIVAEDGDEVDDGLADFLAGNNFGNKNWMKGSLIGEGSFGSVFLALHAVTGELMAVKQVELPSATKGTEFDQKKNLMVSALKHEIGLLQGLRHENIVQYLGTSTDDQYLNIFLEYVPGGSIATMLKQYNTFQEPLIRNFVRQILAGLEYLHSSDIIHRDIKGANVLVDNKGGIKISDFGISKRVEASTMLGSGAKGPSNHLHRPSLQGSVYWMAPEVVRQTAHTKKADIWSLGCLVVEMFIGVHPFPDCSQLQAIFAIGNNQARPPPPENASKEAMAFLDMTFEIDHEKRPSAHELLSNPFLETIA